MRKLVFLLLLISCRSPKIPAVTFREDFENPEFRENWDWIDTCCATSIIRTDSIARTGRYALRIELNRHDTTQEGLTMTELETNMQDMDTTLHWWSFSNYLPADFQPDSVHETFAHWLPQVESCEASVPSPVMLNIYKGNWQLKINWNAKGICNPAPEDFGMKEFDLGPWEKSKWTDWLFHIYFSYGENGLVQVWKNGELVVDYHGPCFYKDADFAYFKIGIMKWVWSSTWPADAEQSVLNHRHYFLDNIRMGNRKAGPADFRLSP